MLRRKVVSRLQARRRAASGHSGEGEGTEVAYSSLESASRNESGSFLIVDGDQEDQEERTINAEGRDEHEALFQASDDLEGLELELEGDDEPHSKPRRDKNGSSDDGGVPVEEQPAKIKPWQSASKDVYEQQLQLMQEQLEYAMIENQQLKSRVVCNHDLDTHQPTCTLLFISQPR